jgi:hypothetical protein
VPIEEEEEEEGEEIITIIIIRVYTKDWCGFKS